MYVRKYVRMYVCMHVCMYVCVCVCTCDCMCVCMSMYACDFGCLCLCVCVSVCVYASVCTYARYVRMYVWMGVYAHVCIYACIDADTYLGTPVCCKAPCAFAEQNAIQYKVSWEMVIFLRDSGSLRVSGFKASWTQKPLAAHSVPAGSHSLKSTWTTVHVYRGELQASLYICTALFWDGAIQVRRVCWIQGLFTTVSLSLIQNFQKVGLPRTVQC